MPVCSRCNTNVGLIGMLTFNNSTKRCAKCTKEVQQTLANFRNAFIHAFTVGLLSEEQWQELTRRVYEDRVDLQEALSFIRGDALHYLERTLTFFYSDSVIDDQEEQYIKTLVYLLQIPEEMARPLLERLAYLKYLTNIRQGHLPRVTPSIHLQSDEFCHLEIEATFHKVNAKSISRLPGRLVATNKKIHFLSPTGGAEIPLKRIMRVDRQNSGIYLELSTKKGNGYYEVPDPMLAEAIIDTLARMDKRQLLSPQTGEASRHIPHDVKQAVWQRDQGKCAQCKATSYLEFDHIIPFSKGGASTINNVQLLCRNCNLSKGSRL